jgi:hypothetical protein
MAQEFLAQRIAKRGGIITHRQSETIILITSPRRSSHFERKFHKKTESKTTRDGGFCSDGD